MRVTVDEFIKLPDPASGHLELHNGEVVSVPPRTHAHAKLQQALFELMPSTKGKGFFIIEFPFQAAGRDFRQADLAFVREERADVSGPWLEGAPDWVIEVLSPSNTISEMTQKIEVCMANGCQNFWLIDPKSKIVSVTEGDLTRRYRSGAINGKYSR